MSEEFIWVTNQLNEPLRDRFDGKAYEFRPKVPTRIPLAAARHIFGYGDEDKTRALARSQWQSKGLEVARKNLIDGFVFGEDEPPRMRGQAAGKAA